MTNLIPAALADSLDDDTERNLLLNVFDPECPDVDPYTDEVNEALQVLSRIEASMNPKMIKILRLFCNGATYKQICEDAKTSNPTIKNYAKSDQGQRWIAQYQFMNRIRRGPSEERRAALLWRIALDNEKNQPRVSISAVDVLNKQYGVYRPEEEKSTAPKIFVQQFVLNEAQPQRVEVEVNTGQTIPGDFSPVTVEVNDE